MLRRSSATTLKGLSPSHLIQRTANRVHTAAKRARREASPALDLPSGHGFKVKLKALEVDDQRVRQHLQAVALDGIHLYQ